MKWPKSYRPADQIERFSRWLTSQGYTPEPFTSDFEVIRVRSPNGVGTHIVYRNAKGDRQTWHPELFRLLTEYEALT